MQGMPVPATDNENRGKSCPVVEKIFSLANILARFMQKCNVYWLLRVGVLFASLTQYMEKNLDELPSCALTVRGGAQDYTTGNRVR